MELFGRFIIGFAFWVLLVFYSAWGYSTSWNMVMPQLFGWSTVTMLQAWVVSVAVSMLTTHSTNAADPDVKLSPYAQSLVFGFVKVSIALVFALLVKLLFL